MNSKSSDNSNGNQDYNSLVKKRLFKWKRDFERALGEQTLNYSGIADMMFQRFNIKTSPSKIRAMLDGESDREVKLPELVALAQIFDIPLWSICELPETTETPSSSDFNFSRITKGKLKDSGIHQLTNQYHAYDYYCYYFNPKYHQEHLKPIKDGKIQEAKMNVNITEGRTIVTFEEIKTNTTFYGDPMPLFKLTGDLKLLENPSIAYSFISDDTGRRAMALMFRYLNLNSDIRYYIPAGMLTFSTNKTHEPLFQKMALFRVRQNLDNLNTTNMLRGILSLNSTPIVIDQDTLEDLRKDETLKRLLAPDKAVFTNCSVFLESFISSNSYFIPDENERMNVLLQIRKNSLYPSQEIISEPEHFNLFIKNHQTHQKEYPEFVKSFKQQQESVSRNRQKSVSDTTQNHSTS